MARGRIRLAARLLLLTAAVVLIAGRDMSADIQQVDWYADKRDPPDRDYPVTLGDGTTFILSAGWSCLIGHASGKRGAEDRTTSCRKGAEVFEFSVQCDPSRPKDHVQIRFRNAAGTIIDFVEVGCRLRAR